MRNSAPARHSLRNALDLLGISLLATASAWEDDPDASNNA